MTRPIDTKAGPANPYPSHHFIAMPSSGGMLDYIGMFIHGFTQTHIDALCHVSTDDGRAWNGKPLAGGLPLEHSGTIDFLRDGTVTRGVLYDVPRHRGTDFVGPGEPVHGWELAGHRRGPGGRAPGRRRGRDPIRPRPVLGRRGPAAGIRVRRRRPRLVH